ncbi:carbon-phosphorus lyase complex subunit PhnI [Sneathiella sp. P13V-1]|uniref:carbon-phosphorus lyase complex subunit PhnI n=1 Tax=Sneathiella sp. P13V-1 TaxID=2697366 RepID=UPI00187B7031|nr:carbon-phosphorus lyase complex subunit PhnI [Sneathiella sp. P13V-1]MBE7638632.1 carbon-phosphorus lyase complex subunit PhnI [Sneathiella sp. P13V-1]
MYVAVKGGERAIENAHKLLAEYRRGDKDVPELDVKQIAEQLTLATSRVMAEGSLYDKELASLAIKQSRGDLIEAIFLMRAYRTTLPRFGYSTPIETSRMDIIRRISATYKDLPGGQILGPTFDYTHRLLDFTLAANGEAPLETDEAPEQLDENMPRVLDDLLHHEGLIQKEVVSENEADEKVGDLTREPLEYPANRDVRLQNLSRGDEGFILSLGYSTQRGYARNHAFVGEIRFGEVAVEITPEELGFPIDLGDIEITECENVNQFKGSKTALPQFTRGYGLTFGQNERKVIAMALVDRALRDKEMGEEVTSPAQDEEFVLSHSDNIEATGFVEHIKLPHYVDFQSELELVRKMRREVMEKQAPIAAE